MSAQYSNDDGISMTYRRRWQGEQEAEAVIESLAVSGRPLVVIDPEDREAVERLDEMYQRALESAPRYHGLGDVLQAALREFANPTPPRPDEPTGLGAVVEDEDGTPWVRCENVDLEPHWYARNKKRDYADIAVVRVLSEGVQS